MIEVPLSRAYLEFEYGRQIMVQLGEAVGSAGSHGEVRRIADVRFDDLVVKLSHDPRSQEIEHRVTALMGDRGGSWGGQKYFRAAWPVARVLHPDEKHVIGFAMPLLSTPPYYPMQIMFNPTAHRAAFPSLSWSRYLMVAADVARGVDLVHQRGYVIGDLCPDNLFVTPAATAVFADVDDWQISRFGRHLLYPCRGSRADYTPPEHLDSSAIDTFRDQSSDLWALAVVIGEILFTGTRPFAGFPAHSHESWEDRDNVEGRQCWLLGDDVSVPDATPSAELLPAQLRDLFDNCFVAGYEAPWLRPDAQGWADTLDSVVTQLRGCRRSPLHVFPSTCHACPWCTLVENGHADKFDTVFGNMQLTKVTGGFTAVSMSPESSPDPGSRVYTKQHQRESPVSRVLLDGWPVVLIILLLVAAAIVLNAVNN